MKEQGNLEEAERLWLKAIPPLKDKDKGWWKCWIDWSGYFSMVKYIIDIFNNLTNITVECNSTAKSLEYYIEGLEVIASLLSAICDFVEEFSYSSFEAAEALGKILGGEEATLGKKTRSCEEDLNELLKFLKSFAVFLHKQGKVEEAKQVEKVIAERKFQIKMVAEFETEEEREMVFQQFKEAIKMLIMELIHDLQATLTPLRKLLREVP